MSSASDDVDEQDLCLASRDGDVALLSQLLANHSFDADNTTAALCEAELDPAIFRILLQHGADVTVVRLCDITLSDTPGELLRLLAEHEYDFKSNGHYILQDFYQDRETLDWLLDQGADINRTDNRRLDDGFNLAPGETDDSCHLLNNVAASGDIELFDHLVSRGADTSLCTALHAASRCEDSAKSTAMVCHLLDKHNMDINRDKDDFRHFFHDPPDKGSPLCSAIQHKNLPVVLELLNRGARVNGQPYFAVSYAAGGFLPALDPLLHAGVDPTEALKRSVSAKNIEAAKICLHFGGADPAPALRAALSREEHRADKIASSAEYAAENPELSYTKTEKAIERERAEERESQAMIQLLKSAME